jgi:hypothetical protein
MSAWRLDTIETQRKATLDRCSCSGSARCAWAPGRSTAVRRRRVNRSHFLGSDDLCNLNGGEAVAAADPRVRDPPAASLFLEPPLGAADPPGRLIGLERWQLVVGVGQQCGLHQSDSSALCGLAPSGSRSRPAARYAGRLGGAGSWQSCRTSKPRKANSYPRPNGFSDPALLTHGVEPREVRHAPAYSVSGQLGDLLPRNRRALQHFDPVALEQSQVGVIGECLGGFIMRVRLNDPSVVTRFFLNSGEPLSISAPSWSCAHFAQAFMNSVRRSSLTSALSASSAAPW